MQLAKHHGLGNDFLIRLDGPVTAGMARALCRRNRGVGADGLISVDGDLWMTLFNADGSRAEVSGNGLRCVGQALARARGVAELEVVVTTEAGPRVVEVRAGPDPVTVSVRVEMGAVTIDRLGDDEAEVDVGNPHLVLRADHHGIDIVGLGRAHPDVNVEVIGVAGPNVLTLLVHERGVGLTEACGTGSCAAAAVANKWGLVGSTVVVRNPGGDVTVELQDGRALLTGPSVFIADVEVPEWH
jgi:diaminopimelate epimerase